MRICKHKWAALQIPRRAVTFICLFAALTALFFGLMCAVFTIPREQVESNTAAARPLLRDTSVGFGPETYFGDWVVLDYYTDGYMLDWALGSDNEQQEDTGLLPSAMISDYARYWHGYMVYLRPALALGRLQDFRWVNALVQGAALCVLAALLAKRLGLRIALCFGVGLALVDYQVVPYSIQYSGVFLVMLGACIWLLARWQSDKFRWRLPYFFFVVGACTSFIDLLTAPMVTMGIPLLLTALLRGKENGGASPLRELRRLIAHGLAWAGGYISLWFGKWLIASVALGRNEILVSLRQILFRAGASAQGYILISEGESAPLRIWENFANLNRWQALQTAMQIWMKNQRFTVFLLMMVLLTTLACLLSRHARKALPQALPLLAIALIAPLWLLVLGQHTAIHAIFAYRNFMPTGLALLCLPAVLWGKVARADIPFSRKKP
ncbi:MAG: hypothetical protein LBC83_03795 [Oscillospiraceae bacterium]|jgi:hypothetical protein|nr:hypothetical protein [Oscillospiraceae bacterium]